MEVSELRIEESRGESEESGPEGYHTVTPQLTLANAAQAIDWYKKALSAQEVSRAIGPDGKITHAEIRTGNSRIMVNDPMMGAQTPRSLGGSPASLWVYVEDCDMLFDQAVAAGAKILPGMGRLQDQFWGDRSGSFTDPEGCQWTIATREEEPRRLPGRMPNSPLRICSYGSSSRCTSSGR